MTTYLITGGAGFIGSTMAKKLIDAGNRCVIFDNLTNGSRTNIPEACQFVEGDIRNADDLEKIPNLDYRAVLHLAAQSSGEISHADPDYDLDTNARGTLNILRWAHDKGITRFLNASSMGVYGQVSEEQCPVQEDMCLTPLSFYGVTKQAGEGYCNYFATKGLDITSFRMFNVYGPGQNLENMRQGMVSIFVAFLLKGEPIHVKGAKDRFRDFIHVDDVVSAWLSSIDRPQTFGQVYNLGTGQKTYVFQLIETLLPAFGKDLNYPVRYEGTTPADQKGIFPSIGRLQKDANWSAKITLKEGLMQLAKSINHPI